MKACNLVLSSFAWACMLACGPPPANQSQDVESAALRFAEAVCETRANCTCDDGRFESTDECESELFTGFVAAAEDGMTFDSQCLDRLLDSEAMTCSNWPWEEFDHGACRVLSRDRGEGEACKGYGELSPALARDCAEGMLCQSGICVVTEDLTFELEIGEPCEVDEIQPCVQGAFCGADNICHEKVGLGEECTNFLGCETGLRCAGLVRNGVGTCAEYLALGDVCDPFDRLPCAPLPPDFQWPGCRPADGEYRCVDELPGICHQTFPY